MIYRIYSNKDTTIYEDSKRKDQNVGKDEILEVGKLYDSDATTLLGNSRALVSFNLREISSSIVDGTITSPEYRLRLENIESKEIQDNYDLFVYPIKDSWVEGLGQEVDNPHHEEGCTWTSPTTGGTWSVAGALVGQARDTSKINSLISSIDFVSGLGGFELVDKIKGSNGDEPLLFVSGGRMAMSASEFGGGTANLSSSLEVGQVYNVEFDFNRETLSGVDFNVVNPSGSLLNNQITNFQESLTSTATYKMAFTASMPGVHKLQFTYFDNNGADGSAGSIDNFLFFKKAPANQLVLDQFSVNISGLPSTYVINDTLANSEGITGSAFISNDVLTMTASNNGGASLNRKFNLQESANYTASFTIDTGSFPRQSADGSALGIEFRIQTPTGRFVDVNDYDNSIRYLTSSYTPTIKFQARETGEHLFRWTFFASGSSIQSSASIDNFSISSVDHDTTGSAFHDTLWEAHHNTTSGGGTWFTSSFSAGTHYTQSFTKATNNLDVPVTEYVNEWINGTRANNGFIIKKSKADENSTTKFGSIKFFSSDTHTIYPPVLETRWDDSTFVTGSLEALTGDDLIVYVKNLSTEYKESSKAKIRVFGRERYPTRTFSSTPLKTVKYLPSTSYYSVVDSQTEQVIIPFDTNYTKLSCDASGNYFNFWFNGLQPERFYKFCFRVDQGSDIKYYDDNFYFKVVR
jgi:hypothetical protein|tara:strand:- start:7731 stop:9806 length:2076 start_codon:yes stop_codon:yes gene_type:complete